VGPTSTYLFDEEKKGDNNMLGLKRITIAQHERGLLFRNRSFVAFL